MSPWAVFLVALGLSMDAFAVSLAAGIAGHVTDRRAGFRLSFHFGLFQFLMPILGWSAGAVIEQWIAAWDHWVAFGLLVLVGGRMIHTGLRPERKTVKGDPTRGLKLVMLSTATSLDALAVGLSLAFAGLSVWYPSVVIGAVTGGMCLLAVFVGNRIRARIGHWAEIVGGLILMLIAFKILLSPGA